MSFVLRIVATLAVCAAAGLAHCETYTNSIGMEFVAIPTGSFLMGTGVPTPPPCKDDPFTARNECEITTNVAKDETPQHRVTISQPFWMGKYEVTQRQWYEVMGNNPSDFKSDSVGERSENYPVEQVSWNDAQAFIGRLNQKEGCNCYRLPTEAEWEYAARAGSTGDYGFDGGEENLGQYAWFEDNADNKTHPVGRKQPNAWGLYDMHGNVYEWVQDWYSATYYEASPATDPTGPASGEYRVLRSGSGNPHYCRAAHRLSYGNTPDSRGYNYGFRVVRVVPART